MPLGFSMINQFRSSIMFKRRNTLIWLSFCLSLNSQAQICETTTIPASTPTAQFIDHQAGTVTDNKTGLMWKKCVEGLVGNNCSSGHAEIYTWLQALQQAATVNSSGGFAGKTDWRLPNIKELFSIVERQCYLNAINLTVFPGLPSTSSFWTSSPVTVNSGWAWAVSFVGGGGFTNVKTSFGSVRLVRSGQ
jgi:hypothetical protein